MFSKKTSPQARRSPAQQEAFFRNRRKALIYSGSVGLSALTGCETLPPALRQLAAEDDSVLTPRVPAFERKGAQARASSQAIFRQVDNRQPVVPAQAPQGLSAPLIAAAKGYEKTKRTLLASLAQWPWVLDLPLGLLVHRLLLSAWRGVPSRRRPPMRQWLLARWR